MKGIERNEHKPCTIYCTVKERKEYVTCTVYSTEWKGKERKGKERKGKERKGKERKGKERKGSMKGRNTPVLFTLHEMMKGYEKK